MPLAQNKEDSWVLKRRLWYSSPIIYLGDGANSLGATFPEHQPLVYVQVLRGLDEAEVDSGLVSCAQTVFIHAQDGSCLPDAPTVYCQETQSQDV